MSGRFSVEAIFKAMDRMSRPVAKMSREFDRFTRHARAGLRDLDRQSSRLISGMHKTALAAGAAATAASFGLAAAAKPGLEFEQQIADLGAAYLKTRDQIAPLEKEALRLGAATKFSATEVAAAMENMAKAGFEEQDALKGIAGMVYAAAAAGEDLATTAENVSAVMKGMGLDVSQSTEVADILALASVKTASSIGSLAESMAKVSSTARQLKIPLKDTVAMVALLQDVGLDASEAGSATATMLTKMSAPTDEVREQMRKMGVSFEDAAGNMLAPTKVLEQLVKAGKGAGGNMAQVAFFADLVGLRGQKAALNLKDLFASGKYDELVSALDKAQGTAKQMSDLRMATLTGDLDVLTENIKSGLVTALSVASPAIREIVRGMTAWLDKNGELVASEIGSFVKSFADNLGTIVTWAKRVAIVATVFYAAAGAIKVATLAMAAFTAVASANPIALIAWAVVGAVALILAFWPEITAFLSDLWEGITSVTARIVDGVGSLVRSVFEPIKSFFVGWFELAMGFWTLLGRGIVAALTPGFEIVMGLARRAADLVMAVWRPVAGFYGRIWDAIVASARLSYGFLADVATMVVDHWKGQWNGLVGFFSGLWDRIAALYRQVMGPVFEGASKALGFVQGVGRGTLGDLFGGSDEPRPTPQVVSPQERVARSINETKETTEAEVTIRDQTGKAEVTRKPRGNAVSLRLKPSGAF